MTELIRPVMDEAEARDITARIKGAAEELWNLLYEAHERQAWQALGYGTWADYVRTEFSMSKNRSYELLEKARFINAIAGAGGEVDTSTITERKRRELAPHLPAITEAIRQRVAGGEQPIDAVKNTIREYDRAPTPGEAQELADRYDLAVPATDGYIHGPANTDIPRLRPEVVMPRWNAMRTIAADSPSLDEFCASLVKPTRDEVIADAKAAAEWLDMFLTEARSRKWVSQSMTT